MVNRKNGKEKNAKKPYCSENQYKRIGNEGQERMKRTVYMKIYKHNIELHRVLER